MKRKLQKYACFPYNIECAGWVIRCSFSSRSRGYCFLKCFPFLIFAFPLFLHKCLPCLEYECSQLELNLYFFTKCFSFFVKKNPSLILSRIFSFSSYYMLYFFYSFMNISPIFLCFRYWFLLFLAPSLLTLPWIPSILKVSRMCFRPAF